MKRQRPGVNKVLAAVWVCQELEIESCALLLAARNEDFVRSFELDIAAFSGDFDASKFSLGAVFTWVGGKRQKILVLQSHSHLIDVWIDADWGAVTREKRIAAGAVANSIEVALADVADAPASTRPAGGRFVNRVNQDSGLLRFVDRELNVRTESLLAQIVEAVRKQQNFPARPRNRPTAD